MSMEEETTKIAEKKLRKLMKVSKIEKLAVKESKPEKTGIEELSFEKTVSEDEGNLSTGIKPDTEF